jgi:hypothetical protein
METFGPARAGSETLAQQGCRAHDPVVGDSRTTGEGEPPQLCDPIIPREPAEREVLGEWSGAELNRRHPSITILNTSITNSMEKRLPGTRGESSSSPGGRAGASFSGSGFSIRSRT